MNRLGRHWLVSVPAALAAGGMTLALAATSDHSDRPLLSGALSVLVGWSFVGSGLVAWTRRPENRTGALMVAVGFTWFFNALQFADTPLVWTLGQVFGSIFLAAFLHLLVSYPSGTLATRRERLLVRSGYAIAALAPLAILLFHERPLAGCEDCPRNALVLSDRPGLANALDVTTDAFAVLVVLAAIGMLAARWRRASFAARRALVPVLVSGVLALATVGTGFAVAPFSEPTSRTVLNLALLAFVSVPIFFLIGILRSRLARVGATRLLVETPEAPSLREAQEHVRRALNDPSAQLAYWVPQRETYVDTDGRQIELPAEGDGCAVTPIEYEDRPVAALIHDPALRDEPELLEEVAAAARLGLEKDRLEVELRARLDELERERDFVRTVVNVAPSFFCVVDVKGRVVRFNRTLERATGLLDDEHARGRFFWDLFGTPESAERIREAFEEAVLEGRRREFEHALRRADGGELTATWSATPLVDAEGERRYLVAGIDVTHRKRDEEELRRSRARIVEAGDAERRRLERNLHDGAQQRLVSTSLSLRLAQARLRSQPDEAERILKAATEELSRALEELRELARGIHPAILTDRGLPAALESLANRAPLPVEVEAIPEERLPDPVEAAAFYVVSESLANVVKYAQAQSVRVSVVRENGQAIVEVADDGVGGADPERGSGLRGLVDRVEALDGSLAVASPPGGGTRVRAEIPCC